LHDKHNEIKKYSVVRKFFFPILHLILNVLGLSEINATYLSTPDRPTEFYACYLVLFQHIQEYQLPQR